MLMYSTMPFLHMEPGWCTRVMAAYGDPVTVDSFLIPQVDIGYILLTDGHGLQTIAGVGHLSITAVGLMIHSMDGCGFPELNGDQHGFHGDQVADIMDGPH